MKRPFPWHLPCFAGFAVLRLYVNNMAVVPLGDIWRSLALSLALAVACFLVFWPFLRDSRRAALGASIGVTLFFLYGELALLLTRDSPTAFENVVLGFFAAAAICLGAWKWRVDLTRTFNRIAVVLVAMLLVQAGLNAYTISQGLSKIPKGGSAAGTRSGSAPDVFYIILDGYGRTDELRKYIGWDNGSFVEGLKSRGFYVAEDSHSNYVQTEQSLCSSLNMDYLDKVFAHIPPNELTRAVLDRLVDQNRVADLFRSHGYAYIGLATGFESTKMRSADILYEQADDISLFETTLLNQTPIQSSLATNDSVYNKRFRRIKESFDTLEDISPRTSRPRFVFAHVVAPHPPFVISANGEMRKSGGLPWGFYDASDYLAIGGTRQSYIEGYKGQAEWLSKRVLEMVDKMLEGRKDPPIIIIQGDHGSKSRVQANSSKETDVREPFRNLSSYFVPQTIRTKLYPSITPVNSFRVILNDLFALDLPLLKDESYFSSWSDPFAYENVTNRVARPLDP